MKPVKKTKSGSVKIDPIVLLAAKRVCNLSGAKLNFYINEAVKEKNAKSNAKPPATRL